MKFDRDTITAELAAVTCKQCGQIGGKMTVVLGEAGPHFARVNCQSCSAFIEWIGFPDAPVKTDRKKSRKKIRDLGERCEICLRHKNDLPPRETLEVHHVLEVAADNGDDELKNLRLYCSACHSLVTWARTYFGHYASLGADTPDVINAS